MAFDTQDLSDTIVKRGGATARHWYGSTKNVELKAQGRTIDGDPVSMSMDFELASKGGGTTSIAVRIGVGDFSAIIECMSAVDKNATLDAICRELSRQFVKRKR